MLCVILNFMISVSQGLMSVDWLSTDMLNYVVVFFLNLESSSQQRILSKLKKKKPMR